MKHIFLLVLIFLFGTVSVRAAHIIGGEMTYECLGSGNYRVTLKLYRDAAGGGAEFDGAPGSIGDATITIFENGSQIDILSISSPDESPVAPDVSNPCLIIPPNVLVEEGIYVFDLNLPVNNSTYTISYQRCCRNNTITNLVLPGDTGATYTIDITPEAQQVCNSSPAFNSLPPIIICQGTDIDFDFSATDPDGDLLTYSLCSPFNGGGNNTDMPAIPTGVAPNPDLPPPYNTINFLPPYTAADPMPGNPAISINSATGLISGVPTLTGQYVVGVCVNEFRNGVLLSTVRRDFQFNVAICEPTVVAAIEADEILADQSFRVISCGESTVTFVNESTQEQFIDEFFWEFDINGNTQTFTQDNPTVDFPSDGIYMGNLVLNPGTQCSDTAAILVEIYPDITADFSFAYDTCVYGPVIFTDESTSDAGPDALVDWFWEFGDGNTDTLQNTEHLYEIPGNLPVSLTITDINDCTETYTEIIDYFPVPTLIVVAPSTFDGCAPADIFFDNLSVPIDTTYDINWDFGDGNTSTQISPNNIYETPGTYTVSVDITSPIGCMTDTIFPNLIRVRPSPFAGFSFTPEQPNNFEPTVSFFDESVDAAQYRWDIDNGEFTSFLPEPVYTFPDTGIHVVQQVVIHESGCTDTLVQIIDVEPQVRYFLPNAFTPNFDSVNDEFRGNGVLDGATGFDFQIWNRYGELVFRTEDPFEAWNGRKNNEGRLSPNGVYVVVATYVNPRGEQIELKGFVTLVR